MSSSLEQQMRRLSLQQSPRSRGSFGHVRAVNDAPPMPEFSLTSLAGAAGIGASLEADPPAAAVPTEFRDTKAFVEAMRAHACLEHAESMKQATRPRTTLALLRGLNDDDGVEHLIVQPAAPRPREHVAWNVVRTQPSGTFNFVLTHRMPKTEEGEDAGGDGGDGESVAHVATFWHAVPAVDDQVEVFEYCGAALRVLAACETLLASPSRLAEPLVRAVAMPRSGNSPGTWSPIGDVDAANHLNESQRTTLCSLRSRLEAVQGPPGTGKSTLISEVVARRMPARSQALIVCARNRAVDSLTRRLASAGVSLVVFGNPTLMQPGAKEQTLGAQLRRHRVVTGLRATAKQFAARCGRLTALREAHLKPLKDHERSPRALWRWAARVARCDADMCRVRAQEARYFRLVQLCQTVLKRATNVLTALLLVEARALVSTVDSAGFMIERLAMTADLVGGRRPLHSAILDEAGCLLEPSTVLLLRLQPENLLLVGDPCQLRPFTALDDFHDHLNHSQSLLERVQKAGHPLHLLVEQYRMHPDVCAMVSRLWYRGRLHTAPAVAAERLNAAQGHGLPGLGWLPDSARHDADSPGERRGFCNTAQARTAIRLALGLRRRFPHKTIYLITFYRRQERLLKDSSLRVETKADADGAFPANSVNHIGTVDSAQGDEADIVIVSLVKSDGPNKFLDDQRRLCVTVSRARESLILVGNKTAYETARHASSHAWAQLARGSTQLRLEAAGDDDDDDDDDDDYYNY